MVCIYCGGKAQVTNSRAQKRLNRTWRRRECLACHAVFTTEESADLATSLTVRHGNGPVAPFSRDKLLVSIYRAVGHRQTALSDAGALTDTIIAQLLAEAATAAVSPGAITRATLRALQRFDTAAGVQYQAYHRG